MLQQTQASRVAPTYGRFLTVYPDPASFAAATPEEVIVAWGNLGYLRRARRLQAAARAVAEGGWPEDMRSLPGVGPYTAAAVGIFAFGRAGSAVDVNLRRVLSRWEGKALSTGEARDRAVVDRERPGDWNQAMMDLGAVLCRPQAPRCDDCPVRRWCRDPSIEVTARTQGRFEGSRRQARAAILKALVDGPLAAAGLVETVGLDPGQVREAMAALAAEGQVGVEGDAIRLI